jgi:hypothetical protein
MRHMVGVITLVMVGMQAVGTAQKASPAAEAFERLKALQGDWIDVDGAFGEKGKVAVTYRVSGAGHTVVETFPVGTKQEMVTVYHLDGETIALTHYCTSNTQPRMTSRGLQGNQLVFDFVGGSNIEVSHTSHMHKAAIEFLGADEIRATWDNWSGGKRDHSATFRVVRKSH